MISRSPSEFFTRFLISKHNNGDREYNANTIAAVLEDHQLESISVHYIETLIHEMEPFPVPWAPTGPDLKAQQATREFLRKWGIHDLYYPTAPVHEAYGILSNPRLREHAEQLLLSPLKLEEIVRRLNAHHESNVTVEGLEKFGHYFWNKKLLSMSEWVTFMQDKPASYERITTLRVTPDVADTIVPWLAGMSGPPSTINTGAVARRMRDIAFLKMLESERHPASIEHSKMMKNYMDVISSAENEMRQSDVALKEVLQAFEKFRMRRDTANVPSIEDVAGLNYSQSGGGNDQMTEADRLLEESTK